MASDHGGVFAPRLRFVRYGRKATKHARSLHYRLWLQTEVRARLIDFRSYSDNRHCCGEVRFAGIRSGHKRNAEVPTKASHGGF